MGEVHPEVTEKYGIGTRAYAAELALDGILELANTTKIFKPLPKYPAIIRDIALVVNESEAVGNIEEVIKRTAGDLLKDVKLFDIYRGLPIPPGKKSVAFSLTYRSDERTLKDDEAAQVHAKVVKALEEELGAILREI